MRGISYRYFTVLTTCQLASRDYCTTIYVVLGREQWLEVFYSEIWISYRWATTGDFTKCMEVSPKETRWAILESR